MLSYARLLWCSAHLFNTVVSTEHIGHKAKYLLYVVGCVLARLPSTVPYGVNRPWETETQKNKTIRGQKASHLYCLWSACRWWFTILLTCHALFCVVAAVLVEAVLGFSYVRASSINHSEQHSCDIITSHSNYPITSLSLQTYSYEAGGRGVSRYTRVTGKSPKCYISRGIPDKKYNFQSTA